MNRYPVWKYILIVTTVMIGALYAAPNLYGEDPALQISAARGATVDAGVEQKVRDALAGKSIEPLAIEHEADRLLVRFADTDDQRAAQGEVAVTLGEDYTVAVNLAPATPRWLRYIGAQPMYLGLDLRGGVHFLMQVDMEAVTRQAEERYVADIKTLLRDKRVRYLPFNRSDGGGIYIRFRDAQGREDAFDLINEEQPDLLIEDDPAVTGDETALKVTVRPETFEQTRKFALQQNLTTLRNRINELGVAEPVIQQQGADRIVVQLPGVQDTARAKEILGATATLEFRMVDEEHDVQDALDGKVPVRSKLYRTRDGKPVLLKKDVMLTGEYIVDASSGIEQQNGSPAVFITLDGKGARQFSRATRDQVGRPMGVVFIENKSATEKKGGQFVRVKKTVEEVINIATIREELGKRFQITGLDSTEEARNLSLLLRAGALAAPVEIIEERTVGPSMGKENIDRGVLSCVIGFVAVLLFMIFYYRVFGLFANVALLLNVVLLVALLSMLQATLTMPGIAGILLTVGMAVDANVLINERIREELRNGNSPQASINSGYERAFATIADSNITTLIAAIVLFGFGTGPVKGFAVTLSLGIMTSMFTAIMGTRAIANLVYGGRRVAKLSI
ncbi:MAG: protein translocase subunit SecD [Gammaproteobacteria bacterium]|nr:protein translocase subunit SecD [Gammaproteobacteria bacterium]